MTVAARAFLAIAAGKAAQIASRRLGRGGGTAVPGLVANRIDPGLLPRLARQLPLGVVMVAGTNGKTTTARMLADILSRGGAPVVHNRSGANLLSGMTSAFVAAASLGGRLSAPIAVMEADEFALPAAIERLRPRLIVLNNLFRDQLDRYGELDTIANAWRRALAALPPTTTLIVNADDPALLVLTADSPAQRLFHGVRETVHTLAALPHAADAAICRRCGAALTYRALYLSHLGDYHCPGCGLTRPPLDLAAEGVRLDGLRGLAARLRHAAGALDLTLALPGFYNVYNLLAATAAARALGLPDATIADALTDFQAPFGRVEAVRYRERDFLLMLAKNPVGFNEVLRVLATVPPAERGPLLIVINDRIADGRDVSWLWDVDFEEVADWSGPLLASGTRAHDMALRLKYAGCSLAVLQTEPAIGAALDAAADLAQPGQRVPVLLTYTALLETRQVLTDRGAVRAFWQQ